MRKSSSSFFPNGRAALMAGLAVAALLAATPALRAQQPAGTTDASQAPAQNSVSATLSTGRGRKRQKTRQKTKDEKVQQTKDTKREIKREAKNKTLTSKDAELPDKVLYDKAEEAVKKGRFDVARLDLQVLLNTYPDSQYQMRAKLAVANSWYKEGGTAALAQAEQEYKDFITFFPNSPEAAVAQMRVGDIYFQQMDVPDRDDTKAVHAEEEYRIMLKQYPDAPPAVLKEARQKLREVQELLATREANLAVFYAQRSNWPAAIAHYDTVIATYPQYSHMDDMLIGLGDAYEAEATIVRSQNLPEGAKAKLEQQYDGQAAAAYRKVVLYHAAAPHAEDAKERLTAMNLPIPTPTAEEVAASDKLEGSRAQYTMRKRLQLIFMRKPDTVTAAGIGAPPLQDPAPTVAPTIVHSLMDDYKDALTGKPMPETEASSGAAPAPAEGAAPAAAAAPGGATAAPTLSNVPEAGQGAVTEDTGSVSEASPADSNEGGSVGNAGASMGAEILTPGVSTSPNPAPASNLPAASGAPDPSNGITAVGAKDRAPLPPVEKPAAAPDQVNEAAGKAEPPAQTKQPGQKKTPKPAFDKSDESSSTHKKKKGLKKLNPF